MVTGGCLCGKIRYKYTGDITEVAMCHCSQCRKAQGGAFATNSPVDAKKLKFTGHEFIKKYESNENKIRAFCQNCGSPLYSARKDLPNVMRLRVGTIDTSFTCENKYHIFSFSKATWLPITDNYPQYEEHKKP